jgi:hypothetical protein
MNELMKILGQTGQAVTFDQIKITMASPEQIRSWSYGEIKKPGNHQLPHLQAGAGWAFLRADLWPDQGL